MLLATFALLAGCSIRKFALNQVADALSATSDTFGSDDDPELVAEAAPFSLKLIEAVLAETPEHRDLLLTASASFTQYAYGFLRQRADELADHDLAAARALRARVRNHLRRGRDYGMRALEVDHPGFRGEFARDPRRAVWRIDAPADVALLYWTAASWGLLISEAKDDPSLVADQPSVEALIDRALELRADHDRGAIHGFLISYEMSRKTTQGDPVPRARQHYAEANRLAGGKLAAHHLALAENVALGRGDKAEFQALLNLALQVDPDAVPTWRLQNILAQRRARWLLGRIDDLFVD